MRCQNKFWLENITELFCNFNLVPFKSMTSEEQMNSITRLVFIIFIILILFNFKQSLPFLVLSLFFIITIYYIQKKNLEEIKKEGFTMNEKTNVKTSKTIQPTYNIMQQPNIPLQSSQINGYCSQPYTTAFQNLQNKKIPLIKPTFCDDAVVLNVNDPNYMSINQKLTGNRANPKTLIAPIIPPPLADLEYWRANNLVEHPAINSMPQVDVSRSGYFVSTNCGNKKGNSVNCNNSKNSNKNNLLRQPIIMENYDYQLLQRNKNQKLELNEELEEKSNNEQIISIKPVINYNQQKSNKESKQTNQYCNDKYNCRYLDNNLDDPNIYTQTIQPGVYFRDNIIEPINSNIGISYTPQFGQFTESKDNNDNILLTENRPDFVVYSSSNTSIIEPNVTESNIYDPRFSGYGTSYRAYTDQNLGQTKYYYDDINAIRMPNYITRNNIDFTDYAPTYGPKQDFDNTQNIKEMANKTFLDSSLTQRTMMQESLLRKRNAEMWQQRVAPISRNGQYMAGGMHHS